MIGWIWFGGTRPKHAAPEGHRVRSNGDSCQWRTASACDQTPGKAR
jgi:hypothetical protein